MKPGDIHKVYFIGIGGIGMSALARYFKVQGKIVAGYDRTSTPLTDQLQREGIDIHFVDDISLIPESCKTKENCLIVYTPAVPKEHTEYQYFLSQGFQLVKRSQLLGQIMENHMGIAIAGTHGKTTISSMIAHIFKHSGTSCNAFLGGITRNYNSNLLLDPESDYFIAEADEFDRSFLTLFPEMAVISAVDDDHLDIYRERKNLLAAFSQFAAQIKKTGVLIAKKGIEIEFPENTKTLFYSLEEQADYYASGLKKEGLFNRFDIHAGEEVFLDFILGVHGKLNIENAVAAFAIAHQCGINPEKIRLALSGYKGVKRRFEIILHNEDVLFIDDYAHHPEELKAFILSVRDAVPGKRIAGIFQPHLYTRTRDFAAGFSKSLSLLDDVILLDVYPAREEPIAGINSTLILDKLRNKGERILCSKAQISRVIEELKPGVLLSMGAGDIDQMVDPIKEVLKSIKY
ncbi:MAG: UDP-N-acetylmuramate--L-alanine ligase [Bacteroidales bacterium]|nr:UDP-N-acetylmuramate--L-alanine ligase [Bacteroidales bacterium]MCB9012988.1 UDP-N-acetylmuramate--L-alanine ligase [Bacteroidales bacterium]